MESAVLEKKLEKVNFSSAIRGYWFKVSLMTMFFENLCVHLVYELRPTANSMKASVTLAPCLRRSLRIPTPWVQLRIAVCKM